ncbi:Thioredoxin F2, chloroplastic [Vitis vinifera]|uniref:Thioredoxin F2, chloroplastic n=1 Tax=Vitis vinifera TaxID=29760 RepID=A0A438CS20_VITVI|nr:Thioredoxin F2, chloroplastic [Vitis vinifera]
MKPTFSLPPLKSVPFELSTTRHFDPRQFLQKNPYGSVQWLSASPSLLLLFAPPPPHRGPRRTRSRSPAPLRRRLGVCPDAGEEEARVVVRSSSIDTAEAVVGQVTEVNKDTFWPIVKAAGDKAVVLDMYTQCDIVQNGGQISDSICVKGTSLDIFCLQDVYLTLSQCLALRLGEEGIEGLLAYRILDMKESNLSISIRMHLPIRIPFYDFTLVTSPAFGIPLLAVKVTTSGMASSHSMTGGVYKALEDLFYVRIFRIEFWFAWLLRNELCFSFFDFVYEE